MRGPLFTIVSPCLNRVAFIDTAVRSVLAQGREDVEHLVIDGGSSDGTLEKLRDFAGLRVASERDGGMYEALNRGLALAGGEIIGFLNSDDRYAPGALDAVAVAFANREVCAVGGVAIFEDLRGAARVEVARFRPDSAPLLEHATLGAPAFNAWFFRRGVFERVGAFDARMRIAGDRDFMLRFALSGLPYTCIDAPVYHYLRHPGSLTFAPGGRGLERVVNEHLAMSDRQLARADLSPGARVLITRLRTRETLELAARSLRRGEYREFLRSAAAGTRRDGLWPLRLARRALGAALRGDRAG